MATKEIDWRTGRPVTEESAHAQAMRGGSLVLPTAGEGWEIRDYQNRAIRRILEETIGKSNRTFLQLATGAGKTVIMAELAKLILENLDLTKDAKGQPDEGIVFMCHRRELVDQAERTFKAYGLPVHMSDRQPASAVATRQYKEGHINIQTAQKLAGRRPRPHFKTFLFCDEGHHAPAGSWNRVLKDWWGHILLVSATPWRLNPREHFLNVADSLITGHEIGASIPELVEQGYLRKPIVQVPERLIEYMSSDILAGDYNMGRMTKRHGMEISLTEIPVEEYLNRCTYNGTGFYHPMKALIFAATQDIACKQVKLLQEQGVRAGALLSDEEKYLAHGLDPWDVDREYVREMFELGELDVIVNCGIVSEGYDVPAVDVVVIGRPTMSLALHRQMIGRSMRPHTMEYIDDSGDLVRLVKTKSQVIDCGGSVRNPDVGHPMEEPNWTLYPRINEPARIPPIMKTCEACHAENYGRTENCVMCGWAFGKVCEHCGIWKSWKDYSARSEAICNLSKREIREQEWALLDSMAEKHFLIGNWHLTVPRVQGEYLGREYTEVEKFNRAMRAARINDMSYSIDVHAGRGVDTNLKANQKLQTHAGKVLRNVFAPQDDYWQTRTKRGYYYQNNYEDHISDTDIEKHSMDLVVMGVGSRGRGVTRYVCDHLRGSDVVCDFCGCVHELMPADVSCIEHEKQQKHDGSIGRMMNSVKLAIMQNNMDAPSLLYKRNYQSFRTGRQRVHVFRGIKFHPLGCTIPCIMPELFPRDGYTDTAGRKEVEPEPIAEQVSLFDLL